MCTQHWPMASLPRWCHALPRWRWLSATKTPRWRPPARGSLNLGGSEYSASERLRVATPRSCYLTPATQPSTLRSRLKRGAFFFFFFFLCLNIFSAFGGWLPYRAFDLCYTSVLRTQTIAYCISRPTDSFGLLVFFPFNTDGYVPEYTATSCKIFNLDLFSSNCSQR